MKQYSPFSLFLTSLIIFIAVANWVANKFALYWRIWWLDMAMHFLGGLWVGATGLVIYYLFRRKHEHVFTLQLKQIFIIAILFSAVVGVGWEVFEFGLDRFLAAGLQGGIADTASDLLMDIIGSIVGAYLFFITWFKQAVTSSDLSVDKIKLQK